MQEIGQYHDIKIAQRLRIFRTTYINPSQNEAARILGIPQSNLSYMENGRAPIRYEFVALLEKNFGLNSDWLGRGEGKPQDKAPVKPSGLVTDMNELLLELSFLRKQFKMMEANQKHFIKIVERLDKEVEALQKKLDEK
jgi:transcriptional regulator with XRE-family HTH domain